MLGVSSSARRCIPALPFLDSVPVPGQLVALTGVLQIWFVIMLVTTYVYKTVGTEAEGSGTGVSHGTCGSRVMCKCYDLGNMLLQINWRLARLMSPDATSFYRGSNSEHLLENMAICIWRSSSLLL